MKLIATITGTILWTATTAFAGGVTLNQCSPSSATDIGSLGDVNCAGMVMNDFDYASGNGVNLESAGWLYLPVAGQMADLQFSASESVTFAFAVGNGGEVLPYQVGLDNAFLPGQTFTTIPKGDSVDVTACPFGSVNLTGDLNAYSDCQNNANLLVPGFSGNNNGPGALEIGPFPSDLSSSFDPSEIWVVTKVNVTPGTGPVIFDEQFVAPEPGTVGLFGFGLAVLIANRLRRRQAR